MRERLAGVLPTRPTKPNHRFLLRSTNRAGYKHRQSKRNVNDKKYNNENGPGAHKDNHLWGLQCKKPHLRRHPDYPADRTVRGDNRREQLDSRQHIRRQPPDSILDYTLTSLPAAQMISNWSTADEFPSDHKGITFSIDFQPTSSVDHRKSWDFVNCVWEPFHADLERAMEAWLSSTENLPRGAELSNLSERERTAHVEKIWQSWSKSILSGQNKSGKQETLVDATHRPPV